MQIIKGSEFPFESAELMDYKLHKIRLKRGGLYIRSPEWLLHKGATVNRKMKIMMNAYGGQQFLH